MGVPGFVITSISAPNDVMKAIARGCAEHDSRFFVIGDVASPPDFQLDGCDYFGVDAQRRTNFRTAAMVPLQHYSRKNIGYLLAIASNCTVIRETDDDNHPEAAFFDCRREQIRSLYRYSQGAGWINVYSCFSELNIWPRGLPLDAIHCAPGFENLPLKDAPCFIHQGLADKNPDVDAIYRLILPLPVSFRRDRRLILGPGSWSPFNSQNTTWWPAAYPLLYLPSYCSFRMTDIWRSFVAQRIGWEYGWSILFHEPTVWQERNQHKLMRDFADEVSGYLSNRKIAAELETLKLNSNPLNIDQNLRVCYDALIRIGAVGSEEMELLDAWLADLADCNNPAAVA